MLKILIALVGGLIGGLPTESIAQAPPAGIQSSIPGIPVSEMLPPKKDGTPDRRRKVVREAEEVEEAEKAKQRKEGTPIKGVDLIL